MNDSVREELQTKITPGIAVRRQPTAAAAAPAPQLAPPPAAVELPPARRHTTASLSAPKTSPTLVEFQAKNAPLPEWRLQLQNAVQQRKGTRVAAGSSAGPAVITTAVAAAPVLKAEPVQATPMPDISDPRVANAMKRIDASRQTFGSAMAAPARPAAPKTPARAHKFNVVPTRPAPPTAAPAAAAAAPAPAPVKPKLVEPPRTEKHDTNRLPALPEVVDDIPSGKLTEPVPMPSGPLEEPRTTPSGRLNTGSLQAAEIARIEVRSDIPELMVDEIEQVEDEIEDLAPFSMRFGAGLFDLIIAGFASMLVLGPLVFSGMDPFTGSGLLLFVGIFVTILFLYMTASVGFFGKTIGMRLFSLELVDAVENEYPTLQQAAVSSSVFIISLAFAGAGFLAALYNEERRALHDLLSGTILVKEF